MTDKPKYDPAIHHRQSIRLRGYDYSSAGLYFITICTQNRHHLFGEIANDEMILNEAGKMIDAWWKKIPEKFPDILLDEYVIMPNHFHAIVENTGANASVISGEGGQMEPPDLTGKGQTQGSAPTEDAQTQGSAPTSTYLYSVVQWFKTMTTNEYIRNVKHNNWEPLDKRIWQRNYHEHIIRNAQEYSLISDYIGNNPRKWSQDKFYGP